VNFRYIHSDNRQCDAGGELSQSAKDKKSLAIHISSSQVPAAPANVKDASSWRKPHLHAFAYDADWQQQRALSSQA
jgi:hypothetical protein